MESARGEGGNIILHDLIDVPLQKKKKINYNAWLMVIGIRLMITASTGDYMGVIQFGLWGPGLGKAVSKRWY